MRQRNHFTYVFLLGVMAAMGCSTAPSVRTDLISSSAADTSSLLSPIPMINPTATFQKEVSFYSLSLSPTGRYLALGSTEKIMLWDVVKQGELQVLEGGARDVLSLTFSPDSRILAAGSYASIYLLDVASGQRVTTLFGHADYVHSLAFSPDGRLLASGSRGTESAIHVWNLADQRLLKRLTYPTRYAETVRALAFSPDSEWLASVGLDRVIRIWDVRHKAPVPHLILFDPFTTPLTLSFSPDQRILASGTSEGRLILYDLAKRTVLRAIPGHQGEVLSLAFSPDGKTLISIGLDKTIRRWEVEIGRTIDTRGLDYEIQSSEVTRDGAYAAAVGPVGAAVFALDEPKGIPHEAELGKGEDGR